MYWYSFNWTFILVIPAIVIAVWAQAKVSKAYNTYSKMQIDSRLSGREVAGRILASNGIQDVNIWSTRGKLTDNYNPRKKTLNLSEANYSGSSIAAVAVAAHESGHAIQHAQSYTPLWFRSLLAPVVSAASYMLWPILILGIWAGFSQAIDVVVYIFVAIFVFQLITLPVEFNASKRALAALQSEHVLSEQELYGAKKMLNAAALTYVAATLIALLNVLRFSLIRRR